MAIRHAVSGQAIDVRPYGEDFSDARTFALFKAEDLEVIRIVLPAGKSVPSHQVAGEITVQCLEGKLEVMADGNTETLPAGHLLYLSGGVEHSLKGVEDSSALVTILLKNKERAERESLPPRELYRQRLQAQLDEWKVELEGLQTKATQAGAEAKQELRLQVQELEKQVEIGRAKLAALAGASDDAWETLRAGVEASWKALRASFAEAAQKFKDERHG